MLLYLPVGLSVNISFSGERVFFGEYLVNAEGEDVVAGVRDPVDLEVQYSAVVQHISRSMRY